MPLADTLLRLAEPPALFDVRWSEEILEEMTRTLALRLGRGSARATPRAEAMREYFPEADVTGYERLIPAMRNHPKDRHVLAAAIRCRADYLVTFNRKDFPESHPSRSGPAVVSPSVFLRELWKIDEAEIRRRVAQQARAVDMSESDLLERLAKSVPGFVQGWGSQ